MGKNRGIRKAIGLQKIEDYESQRVSLVKRRKGIVKKCIELNIMCQQDVFLVIFDRQKQKLLEYRSDPDMDLKLVRHLLDNNQKSLIKRKACDNSCLQIDSEKDNNGRFTLNFIEDFQKSKDKLFDEIAMEYVKPFMNYD
jgi:hypothetical protein